MGKIILVQKPHMQPVKVYCYLDREQMADEWTGKNGVIFGEMTVGDYCDGVGAEELQNHMQPLRDAGIPADYDGIIYVYAVSPSSDVEFAKEKDFDVFSFACDVAEYDMHSIVLVEKSESETDEEFIKRAYNDSRGHNEPSMRQIIEACDVYCDIDWWRPENDKQ